jgi:hypothetical protein
MENKHLIQYPINFLQFQEEFFLVKHFLWIQQYILIMQPLHN